MALVREEEMLQKSTGSGIYSFVLVLRSGIYMYLRIPKTIFLKNLRTCLSMIAPFVRSEVVVKFVSLGNS
jgi:hypothetical protein